MLEMASTYPARIAYITAASLTARASLRRNRSWECILGFQGVIVVQLEESTPRAPAPRGSGMSRIP